MRVTVLGAGLLGVTSAYFLNQLGHDVTVLDRQATPGAETSFANGGQISVSHAEPWANPGAPLKLLQWLGREDAPLLFRLRADMRQSLLNPRRGNWREWDGPVYADFPRVDLARLRAHAELSLDADAELQAGHGAVRAWADVVHGDVLGGTVDLALQDASARLGADLNAYTRATFYGGGAEGYVDYPVLQAPSR